MQRTNEPWFQLCQLAMVEEDPAKMLMLVQEISRLLKEKETWLNEHCAEVCGPKRTTMQSKLRTRK
ncbi:MAG: hypothetical protein DMG80_17230 [Acidobacteria bacterium]|nr:MAG: hypothetical protein DMG80_17230 [Acidobacteriota bacterium]